VKGGTVATFVLIHGAGDSAWHWHLVEPALRNLGHDVVAVDLPCDDDSAGLEQYTETVVRAIGDRTELVIVGQSFGGFTAPLVCDHVDSRLLVLVTAMIPSPGERANDYWTNTGWRPPTLNGDELREELSEEDAWTVAAFMHDVPANLAVEALKRSRDQSETPGMHPWPLDVWPAVPTRFVLCRDDRFFSPDWIRPVVRERLGLTPDEIGGSHCVALSRPNELAARLHGYVAPAG
jgi:pimeloyl-ACP methyl ester carboxylesterase